MMERMKAKYEDRAQSMGARTNTINLIIIISQKMIIIIVTAVETSNLTINIVFLVILSISYTPRLC
jgi:hypothetical protein